MNPSFDFYIGVDGGGTGTRVAIVDNLPSQEIIAHAHGPSSALGQGCQRAWENILQTIHTAFDQAQLARASLSRCAISIGVSGANNQAWAKEFLMLNPGFSKLIVHTDAMTTLWGAYPDGVGIVLALGTGSVGLKRTKEGHLTTVSGWGFPAGDEASGAWFGLKVASYMQKVFDLREKESPLFEQAKAAFQWHKSENFLDWLGRAEQIDFAQLCPFVFQAADQGDAYAQKLIKHAHYEIKKMLDALDPDQQQFFSLCGGVGALLAQGLEEPLKARHQLPKGSSVQGALNILAGEIK